MSVGWSSSGSFIRWYLFCTEIPSGLYYLIVRRGKRPLHLIIFCWLNDLCRLQINIKMIPTPQGTDDKDQACLQRIIIRNRLCSKRDAGSVKIFPFIHPKPPALKLVLAVGPLHLLLLPSWLTPHHSSLCLDVSPRRGRPSWLPYLSCCRPLTLLCGFRALTAALGNLCFIYAPSPHWKVIFLELYTVSGIW